MDLRLSAAQGSLGQDGGWREAGRGDRLEENTTMEEPEEELVLNEKYLLFETQSSSSSSPSRTSERRHVQ